MALAPGIVGFLGPSVPLTSAEGAVVAKLPADLLLAGPTAAAAMRCLGYDVIRWTGDSIAVGRGARSRRETVGPPYPAGRRDGGPFLNRPSQGGK